MGRPVRGRGAVPAADQCARNFSLRTVARPITLQVIALCCAVRLVAIVIDIVFMTVCSQECAHSSNPWRATAAAAQDLHSKYALVAARPRGSLAAVPRTIAKLDNHPVLLCLLVVC